MVEPISLISTFKQLGDWLDRLIKSRRLRSQEEKTAVRSLLKALTTTQTYLEDISTGASEERAKETELAVLWGDAAAAFYGVDHDLAPLLQLKSEAWAVPSKWPDERVEELGITIDKIAEKVRKLLGRK